MRTEIIAGIILQLNNIYNIPINKSYKILLEEKLLDIIPIDVEEDEFNRFFNLAIGFLTYKDIIKKES